MPGPRLTVRQAARLFGMAPDVADAVVTSLCSRDHIPHSERRGQGTPEGPDDPVTLDVDTRHTGRSQEK